MFFIKPKISLSDEICYDPREQIFLIKVVNLTRACLVDLKYDLSYVHHTQDEVRTMNTLTPSNPRFEFIEAYTSKNTDYAVRISYPIIDLNELSDDYYFEFICYAKHPLTNTTKFVKRQYAHKKIVCGRFETGKSIKILRENCRLNKGYFDCDTRGKEENCLASLK